MYAWEMYEEIKKRMLEIIDANGKDEAVRIYANKVYNFLIDEENFYKSDAFECVVGAFACVACNDGKISYAEYDAFKRMLNPGDSYSYDDFFNTMSKYNLQQSRDKTSSYYYRINNFVTAIAFIDFCVLVALVDGSIHENEEIFCMSLCEYCLNHFER